MIIIYDYEYYIDFHEIRRISINQMSSQLSSEIHQFLAWEPGPKPKTTPGFEFQNCHSKTRNPGNYQFSQKQAICFPEIGVTNFAFFSDRP